MNRGILIIGITSMFVTIASVFASIMFFVLTCFDTCPSVISDIQYSPRTALLFVVGLGPAVALILVCWIWQLRELRRMGERGLLIFAATFPVIALVTIAIIIVIATTNAHMAPLDFNPLQLWQGEFGLAVWPLLVSIIAWVRREHRPVASPAGPTGPTGPATPTTT